MTSRIVDVNDNGGHTCNAYDRFGRLAQTTNPNSKTVKYEYDNLGRQTKLTYPDNTYILYYYDAMGRLTDIKNQSNNLIVHYDYDALSRRTATTYGNNTSATYLYDLSDRLKWLVNNLDSDITFEYTAYDKVGNRRNMIMNSDESAYTYDTLYQLKTADYPSAWNIADANCWYDQVGNWTSVYTGTTTTYSHNRLNQYTAVGSVTPAYDSKGNITSGYGGGLTLAYDCENRLTTAGSVSYAYDWSGRRVSRTVSGGTTTYVYDGGQIIAEYNGGTLLRKYIYGPGIDEPVCMVASGGTWYYHFDGLGSVAALTDSGGTLVEKYRYDAFGATTILAPNNQTRTTSLYGNRFMFTGREWDSMTQLYYYRARDYSPILGRFLQPDPIGYTDSMNLYQYCGNNPVNIIDPWGLSTARIWLTDGTKITLIDPTIDEFRNAVASQKNSSIKRIQIAGHGNSENMLIEHGYFGEGLELQNGQVVYTDTRKSFANGVKNKLAKDANIELDGCNTAYKGGWFSNKNNISKQLSNELPGVTVKGNRGVGVGNELFGWNPKGWETHVGGFGRTYKNGHEQ